MFTNNSGAKPRWFNKAAVVRLLRPRTLACFAAIALTTLSATLLAFCDAPADLSRGLALLFVFSLQAGFISCYIRLFQERHARSLKTTFGICALLLATFTLGLFLSKPPWQAEIIPLTLTAMILSLVYNPQFSLVLSFNLTLAIRLMLGSDVGQMLIHLGGLATAILMLPGVRSRVQLVRIGLATGSVYALMTLATAMLEGHPSFPPPSPEGITGGLGEAFRNFIWGTSSGFILLGLLPWIEKTFAIVTDISLVELADGSHPLLQELLRRAPGTYTHSMTVATLAEAGAEAIAANRLLVRVGSYFHDVGKMLKPHYFVENQVGKNRHDDLEPALSTLVILAHVKDGVSLARQHDLPKPILDFIAQHHGTTLVEYFYREAMRLQNGEPSGMSRRVMDSQNLEASFRYPGPKPQTREGGILMLADAVESASRALVQPTPGSLQKLTHDLVMKRLLDGQFEQSGLTLTELRAIEEALAKSVIGIFHARIKYPDTVYEKAS